MKFGEVIQNRIVQIGGISMFFVGLIGGIVAYDDRVAKCDEVKRLEEYVEKVDYRLDQKITQDNIDRLLDRIWKYEQRYGGPGVPSAPPHEREQYYFLKKQLEHERAKQKAKG